MKLRDLIICAMEYEPINNTVAQKILQNILYILYREKPPELLPPGNESENAYNLRAP